MTTLSLTVTAANDGCHSVPPAITVLTAADNWVAGRTTFGRATIIRWSIFRFTNVTIPVGATITSCTMSYTLAAGSGTPNIRIHFEAADNPAMPTTNAGLEGLSLTASYLTINAAYPGTGRYTTADFSAACQEYVDRAGRVSGNAANVIWKNNSASGAVNYQGRQADYNSGSDAATLDITYTTPPDALTATGIATGAPSVGTPTLSQLVALAATGIATGAPSVGTPAIAQIHALAATGVATAAPSVGAPTIGQTHTLTAAGIATAAPSVGSPLLAQIVALAAGSIATGAPSVGAPTLGQTHALTAAGVSAEDPSVGAPTLVQVHSLVALSIAAGAPSVGAPVLVSFALPPTYARLRLESVRGLAGLESTAARARTESPAALFGVEAVSATARIEASRGTKP